MYPHVLKGLLGRLYEWIGATLDQLHGGCVRLIVLLPLEVDSRLECLDGIDGEFTILGVRLADHQLLLCELQILEDLVVALPDRISGDAAAYVIGRDDRDPEIGVGSGGIVGYAEAKQEVIVVVGASKAGGADEEVDVVHLSLQLCLLLLIVCLVVLLLQCLLHLMVVLDGKVDVLQSGVVHPVAVSKGA